MFDNKRNKRKYTNMGENIFAQPSFISGIGRVIDLGSTFDSYAEHENGEQADADASRRDWVRVGKDLYLAISKYKRNTKSNK